MTRLGDDFFSSLEQARLPIRYLAGLFSAGNEAEVEAVYRKLMAVRLQRRAETVDDLPEAETRKVFESAGISPEQADAVYRLTSLAGFKERMAVPPMQREQGIEAIEDPQTRKGEGGFGTRRPPKRRW
jgi:nitrate reductase beta subunit